MAAKPRPLPTPTETTRPFWDAAREGRLVLQYDPVEGAFQFYPRAGSVATGRRNLEWREASGTGTLYAWTVTHLPAAGFEDRAPYLVGLVDLDEGVRILTNLVDVAEDELRIGMRLRVAFEPLSDDMRYFCFAPER